ncbi:hypothetical protein HDU97_010258 [Phlyctochytrium planicorne]|nr:hypothetical protein HDU97_010258 [Phlyctochytrium planicorne]
MTLTTVCLGSTISLRKVKKRIDPESKSSVKTFLGMSNAEWMQMTPMSIRNTFTVFGFVLHVETIVAMNLSTIETSHHLLTFLLKPNYILVLASDIVSIISCYTFDSYIRTGAAEASQLGLSLRLTLISRILFLVLTINLVFGSAFSRYKLVVALRDLRKSMEGTSILSDLRTVESIGIESQQPQKPSGEFKERILPNGKKASMSHIIDCLESSIKFMTVCVVAAAATFGYVFVIGLAYVFVQNPVFNNYLIIVGNWGVIPLCQLIGMALMVFQNWIKFEFLVTNVVNLRG